MNRPKQQPPLWAAVAAAFILALIFGLFIVPILFGVSVHLWSWATS